MPPRPVLQAAQTLRLWQRRALMEYLRGNREDFLAVATPGAGKTTFALRVALELFGDGTIDNITVVTPTEHLKTQWAEAAARVGIELDAGFRNSDVHAAAGEHFSRALRAARQPLWCPASLVLPRHRQRECDGSVTA